jgi:hypothetical protein
MLRVAAALFPLVTFLLSGCNPDQGNAGPRKQQESSFAADRVSKEVKEIPFDGDRAMKYLREICKIGPRMSGTEGMKKQQALLIKHFSKLGGKVRKQTFQARQLSQKLPVDMTNLIVSWYPAREQRVILCCHYDTRPIADQERNRRDWHKPFLSANDGGSGVALLMELAHHIKGLKTEIGIDFVFFDGEEYIFNPNRDRLFFGSEYFARDYRKSRPKYRYRAAILLDMIGGKNARFPAEGNSMFLAGPLVAQVWKIASDLNCTAFQDRVADYKIEDDHLALNRAGIPAIDIIDFSYKHWHRLTDTPENCSADSLEQVARVLGTWVQQVTAPAQ